MALTTALLLTSCAISSGSAETQTTTPIDWDAVNQAVGECLEARGWDIEYDTDGAILSEHPIEQSDAFMADNNECSEENRPVEAELTDEKWTKYYESLKEAADCLGGLGYEVSTPPSRDVFVEKYMQNPWLPHAEVGPQVTREEWQKIERECPQPLIN